MERAQQRVHSALVKRLPLTPALMSALPPRAINTYRTYSSGDLPAPLRKRFGDGVFSANLLKLAAALGDDDAVRILRRFGGNPLLTDDFGRGPFHVASDDKVVFALVAPGRSGCARATLRAVKTPSVDGGTPLLSAAAIVSSDERFVASACAALLEFGADPLMPNNGGSIPLHFCATADAAMRLIHAGGADATVNARNNYGDCPLHLAVSHGFVGVVQVLLRFGADASVPSRIGRAIGGGGRAGGLMLPAEVADVIADIMEEPEAKQALGEVRFLLDACREGNAASHPPATGSRLSPPPLIPRAAETPLLFSRLAWLSLRTVSKFPRKQVELATGIPRSIVDEIIVLYIGPFRSTGESVHVEGGLSTRRQQQQLMSSRGREASQGRGGRRAHVGCSSNTSCVIQ
jgi:hypothetical protein